MPGLARSSNCMLASDDWFAAVGSSLLMPPPAGCEQWLLLPKKKQGDMGTCVFTHVTRTDQYGSSILPHARHGK